MPEEEGKYEADTNAHDPGCQHKHQQSQVGQGLKYNEMILLMLMMIQVVTTLTTAPNSGMDLN